MQKKLLVLMFSALFPFLGIASVHAQEFDDEEIVSEYDDEEYDYSDYSDDTDDTEYPDEDTITTTRNVGKRITCDYMKQEIERLSALEEVTQDEYDQLTDFRTNYRVKCVKKSAGRSHTKFTVIGATGDADGATDTNAGTGLCDTPNPNGCCPGEIYKNMGDLGFNCCLPDGVTCFPPMK